MRRPILAAVTALLLTPSTTLAQDPAPPPPPPAEPPTFAVTPEKVGGKAASALAGDRWRIRGVVTPFVAGEKATVRVYRGTKKLMVKSVSLLPSASGKSGYFIVGVRTSVPGRVTVKATKYATPALGQLVAAPRTVDVLPLRAHAGSKGRAVRMLQAKLRALGYVVGAPGVMDGRTARAVMAFRKVTGMKRTFEANAEVFRRLARGQGRFRVRYPNHGKHVEADISRQVMALIRGGKVERIYHISSGAPGTPTILGSFKVYRKDLGTNALGMVHSSYFIRGYAIHGYRSVPAFNASHGCLRVPVPDAMSIFRWLRHGDRVDTYR